MVFLATLTGVKVTGFILWIHHTRVKKEETSYDEDTWKAVWDPENPSRTGFKNNSTHP